MEYTSTVLCKVYFCTPTGVIDRIGSVVGKLLGRNPFLVSHVSLSLLVAEEETHYDLTYDGLIVYTGKILRPHNHTISFALTLAQAIWITSVATYLIEDKWKVSRYSWWTWLFHPSIPNKISCTSMVNLMVFGECVHQDPFILLRRLNHAVSEQ